MTGTNVNSKLRRGWTTGTCAAAATAAACEALATGKFPDPVTISLPGGQQPSFKLAKKMLRGNRAIASIVKDAGDDPDVTHGAEIEVAVQVKSVNTGIIFKAGSGVGIVTLPGLPIPVGEPAINPTPRKMIKSIISKIAESKKGPADVEVTISIPDGETLAKKTMNAKLGIKGGLSILGTTGIVIPYSCASWVHSIHRGVDVARAAGLKHLLAATGTTSGKTLSTAYPSLSEQAAIDMGDFAGGLLKYLRKNPVEKLTLGGGFGKLTKFANGAMDLHSSRSFINFKFLSNELARLGASITIVQRAAVANTALEVLELAREAHLPLADIIAARSRELALSILSGGTDVEVMIADRQGNKVGHAGFKYYG